MSTEPNDLGLFVSSTNLKAQAIALPIFSFLSIAIIISPLVWHYRNKNIAACTLISWLILSNLFTFINAIIWPDEDFANWWNGTGLCDVEAKLIQPIYTGVIASLMCITRSLARVLRVDSANLYTTKKQRRRMIFIDCLVLFTLPFLQLVLHYVVQTNRYFIIAIGGCAPSFDESWPTIVIMYAPPQIFTLGTCFYCEWNTVTYIPFDGERTLDRWCLIAATWSVFLCFGMGSDSVEIYRSWLAKIGFARIWPSLAEPRGRQDSSSSGTGWISKYSPIVRAKRYFESRASARKDSQTASSNARSHSDATIISLSAQKSMASSVASDNHLLGTSHQPTQTRRPTLPSVNEHPSCKLPDFNNPFATTATYSPTDTSPFPGISGTASPRSGGLFGGHQGSPFPSISLPSLKFSPMNLFPAKFGWKRWSRGTPIIPTTELRHITSPMANENISSSSKHETSQHVIPAGLTPGWESPASGSGSQSHGLQTNIYSSKGRVGSASSEATLDEQMGGIQVRKKMEISRSEGGITILRRDSFTGGVYESSV